MPSDVFPSTLHTWINRELDGGERGRKAVNTYLMRTYAWPLQVYFLGTNSRWLGEPEDVINGFFADRLARPDYMDKWRVSGLRLRRWLMNGFSYYLRELRRKRLSERSVSEPAEEPATSSGDPDAAFDRATVVAFVQEAMQEAAQRCQAEGLEQHWQVFIRQNIDGVPLADLAEEFGVNTARAAVMSRTARRKFRAALKEVLIRDGVPRDQVETEIHALLEVSG